jgi:protein-S-isoprenylcysteine O-methyltransferase Ste14
MALGVPLVAIALGSWVGFVVALAYSTIIVRRVAKEDRFLAANLAGYSDYSDRVRFRLLPGLW